MLALYGIPKLVNLSAVVYSGRESAVKCSGIISDYFLLAKGYVRDADNILGRTSETGCGVSLGIVHINDLDFCG